MAGLTTAVDLITAALKKIRVLGKGDTMDDEDAQDSLNVLTMMLESWSISKLYVFEEALLTFPFVANQHDYTIGPGGNFDTPTRPLKLMSAYTHSIGLDYPMSILTAATQWDGIMNKGIAVSYPNYVWYEQTYPLGTLHFFPGPSTSTSTVNLRFWQQLQDFPTLTTQIALPLGYKQAMTYNLAVALAADFGIAIPPSVTSIAATSLTRLKRYNMKAQSLWIEASMMNNRSNRYNIMSDTYT